MTLGIKFWLALKINLGDELGQKLKIRLPGLILAFF